MTKIEDAVARSKELGHSAYSLTDHGVVAGHIRAYLECQKHGVKFIPGIEAYWTDEHTDKVRKSRHITILAKNNKGLENLYKMVTWSNVPVDKGGGFFYRPRISWKELEKYKEGLIILSGCMNSPSNHNFVHEGYEQGKDVVKRLKSIFGYDNLFIELQNVNEPGKIFIPEQELILNNCRQVAQELDIRSVATNDCFTPDTLVKTTRGEVRIDNVKIGDKVYSHNGNINKVEHVNVRGIDSEIYEIIPSFGSRTIKCSKNHPILVCRGNIKGETNRDYLNYDFQWIKSSDLNDNDLLCITKLNPNDGPNCGKRVVNIKSILERSRSYKKNHHVFNDGMITSPKVGKLGKKISIPEKLEICDDLLAIFGLYLAEGYIDGNNLGFAFHSSEGYLVEIIDNYFRKFNYSPCISKKGENGICIRVTSRIFTEVFKKLFGKGAENKWINASVDSKNNNWSNNQLAMILKYYFIGDGHVDKKRNKMLVSTVSERLAWDVSNSLNRLGICSIPESRDGAKCSKNHKNAKSDWKDSYQITLSGGNFEKAIKLNVIEDFKERDNSVGSRFFETDEFFLVRIEKIDKIKSKDRLWNLQVSRDETYIANGFAVHNSHYVYKEDSFPHEVLKAIEARATLDTPIVDHAKGITKGRLVFNGFDYYVRSEEEMRTKFSEDEVNNSKLIADMVDVTINMDMKMPKYKGMSDEECLEALKAVARNGWKELNISDKENKADYLERIQHEIGEIEEANLQHYFMIVYDVCKFCDDNGIIRGYGRGSCAGSLILYLLKITRFADPVQYGLIWERFYNIGRKGSMPDIDLDIQIDRREEVVEYLKEEFGKDRVLPMMTISTLTAKGVLKDVGKVMGLTHEYMNALTKHIKNKNKGLQDAIDSSDYLSKVQFGVDEDVEQWEEEILASDDAVEKRFIGEKVNDRKRRLLQTFKVAHRLEGVNRNRSTHACAILISDESVFGKIPCAWDANKKNLLTGIDMYDVERLGYMKLDVLGLKTLSVVSRTMPNFLDEITSFDDEDVFGLIARGDNKGVFQLESKLGQVWSKRVRPENIEDLAALISIIRPAVLETGLADQYIENKRRGTWDCIHEDLEPIFRNTFGVMLYQEQMLEVVRKFGNFDMKEADSLRKAVGKKIPELMATFKERFIEGCNAQHNNPVLADELWGWIEKGAEYSFNKCVSGSTIVNRGFGNKNSKLLGGVTIEHLYKVLNDLDYAKKTNSIPLRKKMQKKSFGYGNILSLDGDGRIRPNKIKDIIYTGEKETYTIRLSDNTTVRATKDHKFFCDNNSFTKVEDMVVGETKIVSNGGYEKCTNKYGFSNSTNENKYRPYADPKCGFHNGLQNPAFTNGSFTEFVKTKKKLSSIEYCQNCGITNGRLEHHHIDGDRANSAYENIIKLCPSCHKKEEYKTGRVKVWEKGHKTKTVTVQSIDYYGFEDTYDIEMDTPEHNFMANGLVSSNSHALTYGMMAYTTAFAKLNHPLEFYCSMLQLSENEQKPQEEIAEIFYDAKLKNIEVLPPSIIHSKEDFTISDGKIYFGLNSIKKIGNASIKAIKRMSTDCKTTTDYVVEVSKLKKDVAEALCFSGALDFLGVDRTEIFTFLTLMKSISKKEQAILKAIIEKSGEYDASTSRSTKILSVPVAENIGDAYNKFREYVTTQAQEDKIITAKRSVKIIEIYKENDRINSNSVREHVMAARELIFLGIPIKYCEVDIYNNKKKTHNMINIKKEMPGKKFSTVAVITRVTKRSDKKGREMAFISMTDKSFMMDGLVFADAFEKSKDSIKLGNLAYIEGKISRDGSPIVDLVEAI